MEGDFSVKKKVILSIGGWDENVLNYGDRDLGIRLANAGYRIDYTPNAKIIHLNAPIGGTRVSDERNPLKGWRRSVSILYLAFRHLNGYMFLKYGLYRASRFSFLLKKNFFNPQRIPYEVLGFMKAIIVARRWARSGPKLPFAKNKVRR